MFGLGWSEMVLIGIVALIVIGPKDLPVMFRTLGQFTGKARQMAREFSRAMENAADDAGVKDITKTIKAAANPQKFGIDKLKEATDLKSAIKPGGETEKLSQERAEIRDKIQEATARVASERIAREKAAAEAKAAKDAATAPAAKAAAKPKAEAKSAAAKPAAKPRAKKAATPKPEAKA
jgi:sec-independent protein translocase protein TatB